jgi:CRP/FNR family cyclic AMP-dependent transcriptional regulator
VSRARFRLGADCPTARLLKRKDGIEKERSVMETIERIIAEHSLFAGMNQDLLHVVTGCASYVRFDAGSYIFKEGDEANGFYLIREGTVALEILAPQKVIVVDTLESGDVLGWSWLLPPFHWRFHAHAMTDLRAIVLDGNGLRTKCEQNHDLGYELLKRFAGIVERRLDAVRSQLTDVYSADRTQSWQVMRKQFKNARAA